MQKKMIVSILLAGLAVLQLVLGGFMYGTVNRPQYRLVCLYDISPTFCKVSITIKTDKGKFDISRCKGVVRAYATADDRFLKETSFEIQDGNSGVTLNLPLYYFGHESFILKGEFTEMTRKSGPGQEIAGIVLLVLGGISATVSLVLLFLGLSAKAKGSQGNAVT